MTENRRFPNPSDIETPPGAEGWERMYPYYYKFDDGSNKERFEYENKALWFYDGLHYPEPHYPFDLFWDECWFIALSQYNSRIFMMPPALGIDHRILNGYVYITPLGVSDPEKIEKRIEIFKKRAGYYYKNWDTLVKQWEEKMEGIIDDLENLEFPDLPEMEDESVVFEAKGISSGYLLLKEYQKLIDLGILAWQYHFEFLNLGYAAYLTFVDFCMKAFPGISMQVVARMVSGLDVILYRPDEELRKLAKLAIKLDLQDLFKGTVETDAILAEMEKTENGKKWLEEFEKAKHPWFYLSTGTGWYHTDKAWIDDLGIPLASIKGYIEMLEKGENIDRPLDQIREDRERIANEYRELLENEEDKRTFDELLGLAKVVFPYVENHLFYVEHWFHTVFWQKVRELAQIIARFGVIEGPEDIWFLTRFEVEQVLWDIVTSWATGTKPRGAIDWPPGIEERKKIYQKLKEWNPPPALGTPPDVITEPFTIMLWGITTERMKEWLETAATGEGEVTDEVRGFPGSPGIVEGPARVARNVEEIDQIQEGEILVAPTTSPSWAPAFTKIKAAVTDVGGIMCHAAIVCREYGLPAVVGTGHATKQIKTGDIIKVDGNNGVVKIIKRD
jgi:pyruvate,water dikinase